MGRGDKTGVEGWNFKETIAELTEGVMWLEDTLKEGRGPADIWGESYPGPGLGSALCHCPYV